MKRLSGVVTPLLTPFNDDGSVDFGALKALIDFVIGAGVHGVFPLGTTGEAVFMSRDERMQTAEAVIQHVDGRVPVFIQVGAIPTAEAVALARHAQTAGADGIGVLAPYYFTYSQEALREYFREIIRAVPGDFPVYLYNFPGRTSNDVAPSLVAELKENHPNIVGIKNSMDDLRRLMEYRTCSEEGFSVLVGADHVIAPAMLLGSDGAIAGTSNVFPEVLVALMDACRAGKWDRARSIQDLTLQICSTLRWGADMAWFKAALDWRGLRGGRVRRPFVDLTESARADFTGELDALRARIKARLPEVRWWASGGL